MENNRPKFKRDPREFDASEFYIGIAILLFGFQKITWGFISLGIRLFIWLLYKIFSIANKKGLINND